MKIYDRDYMKRPSETEYAEYKAIHARETAGRKIGAINLYHEYPAAIRHYNSLFPNNHIDLFDYKANEMMDTLLDEYASILNDQTTTEREILNFINHKSAHFIIASLFNRTSFSNHEAYIFPEFIIGGGIYRADYLLVGKNSGGYEFLFVELEAPNGRTTIKNGHPGQSERSGINQIKDWKSSLQSDYDKVFAEYQKHTNKECLPLEFQKYDHTRFHYAVVTGRRDDYNNVTYRERRETMLENNIMLLHYDNLFDYSVALVNKHAF